MRRGDVGDGNAPLNVPLVGEANVQMRPRQNREALLVALHLVDLHDHVEPFYGPAGDADRVQLPEVLCGQHERVGARRGEEIVIVAAAVVGGSTATIVVIIVVCC